MVNQTPTEPPVPAREPLPRPGGWWTPMQTRTWLEASQATAHPRAQRVWVTVPGGLVPLARHGRVLATLLLVGAEALAEPIAPLVVDAEAAQLLARALIGLRLPVRFGQPAAEGPFLSALARAARGKGLVVQRPAGGSPVMRLDAGWAAPYGKLEGRRRADLRRMQRRAEAFGPVSVEILRPRPDEVDALFDRALGVEAASWKSRAHTAVVQSPVQEAFLRRYGREMAATGQLRIAFLSLGDQTAAMQVMVEHDGALWLLKIGYDERFGRASPGTLLMLDVVRRAAAEGFDRLEFLGKAAPWTALWSEDLHPHVRLRYYPFTLRGLAVLAVDSVRFGLRRAAALWPGRQKVEHP